MTRNNLRDHLTWLLANIALSAPDAPVLPPVRDQFGDPSQSDTTPFFTPSTDVHSDTRTNDSFRQPLYPVLPGSRTVQPNPIHGTAEADIRSQEARDGEGIGGTMGRLVARSASKRPNLVLRQEQLLTPTSTTGAGSLTREYSAFIKKSGNSKNSGSTCPHSEPAMLLTQSAASAISTRKRTSPRHRPLATRPENPFMTPGATLSSDHALDAIDLTHDSEQTSPNSVAFGSTTQLWREDSAARPDPIPTQETSVAFGSDVMLWQEGYASRPEPVPTVENSVAFGSPVRIWDEDTAMRPQPSAKRGKKRKSDQISQPPPPPTTTTSTDDFPDIYELISDEEPLPARAKPSPSKSPAKTKRKTSVSQTPSRTAAVVEGGTTRHAKHGVNPARNLSPNVDRTVQRPPFKTPRKDRTGPSVSSAAASQKAVRSPSFSDSVFEDALGSPIERQVERSRRRKREERVIQDSDDEVMTPLAHHVPSYPAQSASRNRTPVRKSQEQSSAVAFDTPSKSRGAVRSEKRIKSQSPRKRDRDVSLKLEPPRDHKHFSGATPSQESQPQIQSRLSISDEEQSAILDLFLKHPSVVERKRILLDEGMQRNRDAYKKALEERDLLPRARLKQEKEQLIQQQAALEALSNEYRSYEELQVKREALIGRISNAYAHNLDTEDEEARLDELDNLLKELESSLKEALPTAGIDNRGLFRGRETGVSGHNRTESIVQATQLTRPLAPASLSRETTLVPGGGSTQVVFQTQWSPTREAPHAPSGSQRTFGDVPVQETARKQRHRITSPSPRRNERPDQRTLYTPNRSESTRSPTRQMATAYPPISDNDEDDPFDNSLPLSNHPVSKQTHATTPYLASTKVRKSPSKTTKSYQRDYESDYSDDVDMVEFAEEFELHQSSSEREQAKSTRSALSETSGNAGLRKEKSIARRSPNPSTAPPVPPELRNRPWYRDVKKALKDRFRMGGFRHNQLEAINATLSGNDAFILMPTGGGKSLCYQLPAVISSGKTSGVTVVVSPLISLMQDQIDHLRALNIQAASFNGETNPEQRNAIMGKLKERYPETWIQLLYVTPEMINKSKAFSNGLDALYRNKKLARLVIDEAHCVSQWGHDFRPDYKELGSFRESFPGVPLMALTATATQNVIMDVKHNLGIEQCEEFSQSFNRPNLYYEVLKKEKDNIGSIAQLINDKYPGKSGIVYTLSRRSAESIAEKLQGQGIAAHHYHAHVDGQDKVRIQKEWQQGRIKVVVATIAFGMGIDKPDVRFVIHQSIPKSLEGYYQETGRAGRDGKPSECYLYFGFGDVTSLRKMISEGEGSDAQKERQRNMLDIVTAFCDNQSECRRVAILRYFGESFGKAGCGATCDNCKTGDVFEQKNITKYAVAALRIVRSQGKLTLVQCTDYLMGKKKKSDFKQGAEQFHGMAKHMPKHEIHRIIDRLVAEDALMEDNIINKHVGIAVQYFRTGNKAHLFLTQERQLLLTTRVKNDGFQGGVSTKTQRRLPKPAAPATRRDVTGHPPSTNVSSPAQARANKNKGKVAAVTDDEKSEDDYSRHSNGYARDGFVIDDSDDDFEAIPPPKKPRQLRQALIGPPISRDARMGDDTLDDIHKDIIQSFLTEAKGLEEHVRTTKGLRAPIFTETQLREMALRWTLGLDQMRAVPGIDQGKVEKYGNRLLPLIQQYHQQYQEIMEPQAAIAPFGSQHSIVDLVSDDDLEMEDIDEDEVESEEGETSGYFQPSEEVQDFYAQLDSAGQQLPSTSSRARSGSSAPRGSKSTRRGSKEGGGKRKYTRRSSGGSSRGGNGGVKKRGGGRKTAGGASSRSTSAAFGQSRGGASGGASTSSRGKSKPQGVGFSGIGLMEH